jgi:acyl-CoA hydrolase
MQASTNLVTSIYDLRFSIYYSRMNSDPAIRITMLPRDTNSQGTIFGGVILSYIDMAGAIEAHRQTGMDRFVTVAMREVIFHRPVFVGDLVSFYSDVNHRARRSGSRALRPAG